MDSEGRAHAPASLLRDVFDRFSTAGARVRVEPQEPIYATGDADDSMYFIEVGQVKLFMSSASGKDLLIAIYTAGEVFGESCFAGARKRIESASAMIPTVIRKVARREFASEVQRLEANDALVRHLATRSAERQTALFDFVTMDAERRLAKVLLQLAEKLGVVEGAYLRIEQRISQEELSQIVGTTRPRVTAFMQRFRQLDIIDTPGPRSIRVHRQNTRDYLARGA